MKIKRTEWTCENSLTSLRRYVAFRRGRRANVSYFLGEAIRTRKYIHLIHPRCNEIEYVLSAASLSYGRPSPLHSPAVRFLVSSNLSSSVPRNVSSVPFQVPLSRSPCVPFCSSCSCDSQAGEVGRQGSPAGRQSANQPARRTSFRRADVPQLLLRKHSSSHHLQLYLAELIRKFLCSISR